MGSKKKSIVDKVEEFRYSDSVGATAAKILLTVLAAGPMLIAGAVTPGILSSTRQFQKSKVYTQKQYENAYRNLKHRKLIEIIRTRDGKTEVKLTNKGENRVKSFSLQNLSITKPNKWDGKWRILIFDIPSQPKIFNNAREALRRKIKELKFSQIQKSVWAYPYECEDEILFIAETYRVQKYIEIITAEKVLHEEKLKRKFNL